jgi:hypothetical protein
MALGKCLQSKLMPVTNMRRKIKSKFHQKRQKVQNLGEGQQRICKITSQNENNIKPKGLLKLAFYREELGQKSQFVSPDREELLGERTDGLNITCRV